MSDDQGNTATSEAATLTVTDNITLDDVTYERITDSTLRVVSYSGNATSVVIPQVVEGMTVVEIGEGAFEGNTTIESVTLPSTITIIRARAFKGCSQLSEMR